MQEWRDWILRIIYTLEYECSYTHARAQLHAHTHQQTYAHKQTFTTNSNPHAHTRAHSHINTHQAILHQARSCDVWWKGSFMNLPGQAPRAVVLCLASDTASSHALFISQSKQLLSFRAAWCERLCGLQSCNHSSFRQVCESTRSTAIKALTGKEISTLASEKTFHWIDCYSTIHCELARITKYSRALPNEIYVVLQEPACTMKRRMGQQHTGMTRTSQASLLQLISNIVDSPL